MALPKLGFAKRLLALYGFVFIVVIMITDWSLSRVMEKRNLEQLENSLVRQSILTSNIVRPMLKSGAELQERVQALSQGTDARITVIDPEGKVLADSDEAPADLSNMDNHSTRPEVAEALKGGSGKSIRYSMTLKTRMLYVAIPIFGSINLPPSPTPLPLKGGEDKGEGVASSVLSEQKIIGVVRTAMPITRVDEILATARKPLFLLALAAIVVVFTAGFLFANRLTERIRRITSVAERYSREDWSEKVLISGKDELKLLADTMNHMAKTLKARIEDLESEKGKIAAILDNMVEAVIAIDRHKHVIFTNLNAEKLFGFENHQVRGKSLIEVTRNPYLEAIVDRALNERRTVSDEIQLAGKRAFRVSVVVTEERTRDIGGILVLHDVTEIRRFENIRKDFVANVSHELRTPITSIKGFIETLLAGAHKDAEKSKQFLQIVQEDAARLGRLVEDILMLGEIEQGAAPFKKEKLDLYVEVRAVLERFKPQLQARKILVEDELPTRSFEMTGDRDKVRQVFVNLIDNAIKFNNENGKIVLSSIEDAQGVQVSIEDTGAGIPQEALDRIFERFFRVDKARSRELGGTGLGLSIVKHIMEAHNGRVTCQSQPGKGSTFSVFFPTS